MDLDINNYSFDELLTLFKIDGLTETNMREAKHTVLKTHPDKSKLDAKYFLFYSSAYKRLYEAFEFNKRSNKYSECDKRSDKRSDNVFVDKKDFHKWFNDKFDKEYIVEETGYGDWLKTDDGLYTDYNNVSKTNMNAAFETQKQKVQSIIVYSGVQDFLSTGGTSLTEQTENFTDGSYTDIRQAYVESVIPVSQRDFDNAAKYKTEQEYKQARFQPMSKEQSLKMLFQNKDGAAQSYQTAQQIVSRNVKNIA
jgi:hypothetical protein